MPRIMISYRRVDSQAIAGRIFDRLTMHYGNHAVFMDIDSISYGVDFRVQIDKALRQTDIVIAIVGPQWLRSQATGGARIHQVIDPVRVEMETAFQRKARIIPVLVGKAIIPKEEQLPASLSQFAYLNAMEFDAGQDFNNHMNRLIAAVDAILGIDPATPAAITRGALHGGAATCASEPMVGPPAPRQILIAYAAVPAIAILVLHYLIVIKFDLNSAYLRVAATAVPLLAGYLLAWQARRGVGVAFLLGAVTAMASVIGMNTIVGFVDSTPIMPPSPVEWQESFEYAAGIALAMILGNALARAVPRGRAIIRRH
jgi:hypothetical protein